MQRRSFIKYIALYAGLTGHRTIMADSSSKTVCNITPLKYADYEWKQLLSMAEYKILREEDTERAFSSALNNEKRKGVFVCAGCSLELFHSHQKYDSGTGWPSFFESIPCSLETRLDFKLIYPRTEYHCARCGGHQGHIFNDGPQPSGKRWCNNGLALKFIADEKTG